jgi:hypothetical protein
VHAHEKQPRFSVAELRRVYDVATMVGQKARHAVHDTALVQAGQGKDVFWMRHVRKKIG